MASSRSYPVARVGIVGGGQLARMMAAAAKRLGCTVTVLDPTPDAPAASLADAHIRADYFDAPSLRRLVESCDVTTYDLENVGAETLMTLADEGHRIVPDPGLLSLIQDKRRQKAALREHGIPTADFTLVEEPTPEAFANFGYPLVQKAARGGYDGKGVAVLRGPEDWKQHLPVAGLVERFVEHRAELAVLVARGHDGDTRVYPVVEMVFLEGANVLDLLLAPARLDDTTAQRARDTARRAIEALDGVGVFGVELFWTLDGEILVNEISPRTHNSGHYTIEACDTDQFEQHLRAVIGLPLGDTRQHTPAALLNLLGEPEGSGTPRLEGLDESLSIDGVHVHWYGKATTKPYRKMGHVTVLDPILERAAEKAHRVKGLLRIHAASERSSAEDQQPPS